MSPSATMINGVERSTRKSQPPCNFDHHFSRASKKRIPNSMKEYYKFLRVPGMSSFAGGSPYPGYFPFDSIKLSVVEPKSFSQSAGSTAKSNGDAKLLGLLREPDARNEIHITRSSPGTSSARTIDLDTALNYGSAQGYPSLYAWLKKLTTTVYHPNIPYAGGAEIMINGGSADGLSKIYEVFFNHWDEEVNDLRDRQGLVVEEFVYAPPVSQVRPWDVNIVPIKMDVEGMLAYGPGGLSDVLQNWDYARGKLPHMVYLVPTGQNPASGTLSFKRRTEIYEVCSKYDLIIVEDDPYWNLYYPSAPSRAKQYRETIASTNFPIDLHHNYSTESLRGRSTGYRFLDEIVPSFLSIDTDGRVVRLDTFSKTIAPGCRLGWTTASPAICEQLFRVTDGTSQQPSGFSQAIVAQLIGEFDKVSKANSAATESQQRSGSWGSEGWICRLEGLRNTYQQRMVTMATILEHGRFAISKLDQVEMFTFNWSMGGMFIWLKVCIFNHPLASSVDAKRLMKALWMFCTEEPYRILTNPGGDFAASPEIRENGGYQFLRLGFASVEETVLKTKSQAFVDACRKFWSFQDPADVDRILQGEDALLAMGREAVERAEFDREVIEDL